jgi:enediyne biosynthesis protein E7
MSRRRSDDGLGGNVGFPLDTAASSNAAAHRGSLLVRLAGRKVDSMGLKVGGESIRLLNTPDFARHVLTTCAAKYTKTTSTHRHFRDNIADGIVTAVGSAWADQRALLAPLFRDSSYLTSCAVECLEHWAAVLARHAESGEPVNLLKFTAELTLTIATKAMFNLPSQPFVPLCTRLGHLVGEANSSLPPESADLADTRQALLDAVTDTVACQRAPGPVLRALIEDPAHTDRNVLANQIATLLIAGFETTAHTVNWAWVLLMQHPEVYARLADSSDLARGVVEETLRLYPTAWIISREAAVDDQVGGVDIAAGTTVVISPFLLHRHPRWWRHPDRFEPGRFGPGRPRLSHRYAYIPFGAGPRFCIGTTYALEEARLILSRLARQFTFAPVADIDDVCPEFKFVLRPSDPLLVTVHNRERSMK